MKDSFGDKVFHFCNYFILTLGALTCLFPLLHLVALSLSGERAILSGFVTIWPIDVTLQPYKALIQGTQVLRATWNSLIITGMGTLLSVVFTLLAAYPLSRKYFPGRRFFTLAIVFTMLFQGGLIPTYLVINSMNLVDTYLALWLIGLVSPFNMLIMRTYLAALPEEVEESARIDGSGEWRLMLQIMLPLSLPMLATISLFYGVAYWNSFFHVLIYINDTKKWNLSVLIQNMIRNHNLLNDVNIVQSGDQVLTQESIKSAGIITMILPMLIVYPLLQKYFVKGAMIGAVKG